jgi:hypothetical protein
MELTIWLARPATDPLMSVVVRAISREVAASQAFEVLKHIVPHKKDVVVKELLSPQEDYNIIMGL